MLQVYLAVNWDHSSIQLILICALFKFLTFIVAFNTKCSYLCLPMSILLRICKCVSFSYLKLCVHTLLVIYSNSHFFTYIICLYQIVSNYIFVLYSIVIWINKLNLIHNIIFFQKRNPPKHDLTLLNHNLISIIYDASYRLKYIFRKFGNTFTLW